MGTARSSLQSTSPRESLVSTTDGRSLTLRVCATCFDSHAGESERGRSPFPGESSSSRIAFGYAVGEPLAIEIQSPPPEDAEPSRASSSLLSGSRGEAQSPLGIPELAMRYSEEVRLGWPDTYRFQVHRASWRVAAQASRRESQPQHGVLQMAVALEERTLENVERDIEDAEAVAALADDFNAHVKVHSREATPQLKVAMPIACEIIASGAPELAPIGSYCTLVAYAGAEVHKFAFDGAADHVNDVSQAFLHYATFESKASQFCCDLQGEVTLGGDVVILDPCMIRNSVKILDPIISQRVGKVFDVVLERDDGRPKLGLRVSSAGKKLGITIDAEAQPKGCEIVSISEGLAKQWNAENPKESIFAGDIVIEANGMHKSVDIGIEMLNEGTVCLKVQAVAELEVAHHMSGRLHNVEIRERFDSLHPTCNQICKTFDADRRCQQQSTQACLCGPAWSSPFSCGF